jgi:hypothetical protein
MTFVLARTSRNYVLQIADRLVTRADRPYDASANKTILYRTANGIVTIGYTGLAYVGDVPTDKWIVEQITGITAFRRETAVSVAGWQWKRWARLHERAAISTPIWRCACPVHTCTIFGLDRTRSRGRLYTVDPGSQSCLGTIGDQRQGLEGPARRV